MRIFKNRMAKMLTASLIGALFLLVGIGTLYAQQPTITATLKAIPESYSGKCPTTIKFEGEIKVANITKPPLKVQYKFIRSDGAFAPVETLTFERDGTKVVSSTWTLGKTYGGWEAIKVVYPQDVESNKANFKIQCEAEAKPQDLTIKIINCPQSAKAGQDLGSGFQVMATNSGDTAVKDIAVDIVLRKDPTCPSPAPFAVYSPNYSSGVLLKGGREHVSLNPGQTLNVKLNGTNTIPADTPTGSYYLCAVIDAGNKVKETNEGNNCACCPIRVAAKVGLPDLKVVHTDHQPAGEVRPGQVVTFSVTVKNIGEGAAKGTASGDGYMIDLSFHRLPIADPVRPHTVPSPYNFTEGMLLKGGRISNTVDLAPGVSKQYSASVEIPKDIKPGRYWIGVSLDPFNKVAEGRGEEDNATNHGITVR